MKFGYYIDTSITALEFLQYKFRTNLYLIFTIDFLIFSITHMITSCFSPYSFVRIFKKFILPLNVGIFLFLAVYIILYKVISYIFCARYMVIDITDNKIYIKRGWNFYSLTTYETNVYCHDDLLKLVSKSDTGNYIKVKINILFIDKEKLLSVLQESGCEINCKINNCKKECKTITNNIESDWQKYQRRDVLKTFNVLLNSQKRLLREMDMLENKKKKSPDWESILQQKQNEFEKYKKMISSIFAYYEGRTDIKPDFSINEHMRG